MKAPFMGMLDEPLPFTVRNRPWLTNDCIEAMNEQYMSCMAQIKPEDRERLKEWAAVNVEMHACHDKPDLLARCREWGEQWAREQGVQS
jgi:hypothetical protein